MKDQFGKTINYMRISVTDRCNLRCIYCMPPDGIQSIPHGEILSFEEILRVAAAGAAIGIDRIKITGGEPLVRKNIVELIRNIKKLDGIHKVTLTTNGVLFSGLADALAQAGLDAVNFSLDTLDADKFAGITRVYALDTVMHSIDLALQMGLATKINCVPIQSYNDTDLTALAGLAKNYPMDVRFIEMMPIGLGRQFATVKNEFVLQQLAAAYGEPIPSSCIHGNGPASYYNFPDFKGSIGLISAVTNKFCGECNRVRLTSDGKLMLCLCNQKNLDLKKLLRDGISQAELETKMESFILRKPYQHNLGHSDYEITEEKNMFQIGG